MIRARCPSILPRRRRAGRRAGLATVLLAAALAAQTETAAADFRVCNTTEGRVGVAIGHMNAEGWTTEGWWNLEAESCETILRGELVARYYYVYAIDYDHGGEWSGEAQMCTRDERFTIRGIEDCEDRGHVRTGFLEIDTREQASWTVQLTDPAPNGVGGR